ncbi:hypothetical protein L1987_48084 [Smallanthus sonchifolius]|uniref:Uncharacterized protein n=1 Tax=Smallanthus sonchifolius TaxID=185202 RepID=A0ACB9FQZ1_9ASTR|nr:hypothetical protein L1987_48084 [Smallanthus sonchifolius]
MLIFQWFLKRFHSIYLNRSLYIWSIKSSFRGDNPIGNTSYDVLVDVPSSLDKDMSNFLENLEKHKEIDACDEVICSAIKKIHEHRRRWALFLGFSQSPLIATRNAEKEQRAEFYNQPWVEDAVIRYLNRKPTA